MEFDFTNVANVKWLQDALGISELKQQITELKQQVDWNSSILAQTAEIRDQAIDAVNQLSVLRNEVLSTTQNLDTLAQNINSAYTQILSEQAELSTSVAQATEFMDSVPAQFQAFKEEIVNETNAIIAVVEDRLSKIAKGATDSMHNAQCVFQELKNDTELLKSNIYSIYSYTSKTFNYFTDIFNKLGAIISLTVTKMREIMECNADIEAYSLDIPRVVGNVIVIFKKLNEMMSGVMDHTFAIKQDANNIKADGSQIAGWLRNTSNNTQMLIDDLLAGKNILVPLYNAFI